MNNFVFPILLSPLLVLGVIGYLLKPVVWFIMIFRKPIGIAIFAGVAVAGVYWQEIMPIPDIIKGDHQLFVWLKYGMPALILGWGAYAGGELLKD